MKLSILPKAAPAWFPYPEHRSMTEVMAFKNNVRLAGKRIDTRAFRRVAWYRGDPGECVNTQHGV